MESEEGRSLWEFMHVDNKIFSESRDPHLKFLFPRPFALHSMYCTTGSIGTR